MLAGLAHPGIAAVGRRFVRGPIGSLGAGAFVMWVLPIGVPYQRWSRIVELADVVDVRARSHSLHPRCESSYINMGRVCRLPVYLRTPARKV